MFEWDKLVSDHVFKNTNLKSGEFKMTHQAIANRFSLFSLMMSIATLIFVRTDGHHV